MKDEIKTKHTVIILNGTAGAGKDTFIKLIEKHSTTPLLNISSVDLVKKAAEVLGWPGTKTPKDRRFLSNMKDLSTAFNDGPFKYIIKEIHGFQNSNKSSYTFVHVREAIEIQKLKRHYLDNSVTLLITGRDDGKEQHNHSDLHVRYYPYAYTVSNKGTLEDLEEDVKRFLEILGSL